MCEFLDWTADAKLFRAAETGIVLLFAIKELWPNQFAFLPPVAEGRKQFIELLFGNSNLLNENVTLDLILADYEADRKKFMELSAKYWIYN